MCENEDVAHLRLNGYRNVNVRKRTLDLKIGNSALHLRVQLHMYKAVDGLNKYEYTIGICTPAMDTVTDGKDVAVVQVNVTNRSDIHIIGKLTNTKLIEGTDWLLLEYRDGDQYGHHCGTENRRATIMITCDSSVKIGEEVVRVFEEETDRNSECYYLFEMASSAVCPASKLITVSLSVGTILVIVFFSVTALYIILGFIYNRFVLHAKGKDQIPNYEFWQDFGNLQADGCDLICRTRRRQERSYKGVGDDQLTEEDERDEHLLPM
ncbi:hypothetical protein FSP39_008598 [Pinctada imbricata]|uniref:MRH domain-containing protein n=1 Tax=Pinctada imbricata TaxID=66713 RepID=A0AA89BZ21_PINIB|nr:hypothetical protein FSP39_008598 [Pinctada imbricata]